METNAKKYSRFSLKFFLSLFFCLLVRLIPFRAPNIEPLFATVMPLSGVFGSFAGFSFAVLSVLLYDFITGTAGVNTFFVALAYGAIGLWAARYFKNHKLEKWNYVRFAVMGTLVFDALTGLTIGPIFFHQSFFVSLSGQIPFTLLHLTGNIVFAFAFSPILQSFLIKEKEKKREKIGSQAINIFNPKII